MATATATRLTPVVHPIRNVKEFDAAVVELDTLIDRDPKEGTAAYDRMELLTILIEAYEAKHLPAFEPVTPQELVRFMAEQKGLDQKSLADLLGGRSRLSEFYNGVRSLSRNQIVKLRETLGIPADLLLE
jgi:HTH-type transcriptional regulator/antitoxin HigA